MPKVQSDFYFRWAQSRIQATYTADQTLTSLIEYVGVDTASNTVEIELPDSSGADVVNGKIIWIIDQGNAGTNNIMVIPNGSDGTKIDGLSRIDITSDNEVVGFQLTDSTWVVLGKRGIDTIKTVSTTYTALQTDELIISDTSGGAFTITLVSAVGMKGRKVRIKKVAGGAPVLTIAADGAELIDGSATEILVGNLGPSRTLESDNVGWVIV